jgi:hypothetical protein
MKVIGAGFGRTGTSSLQAALEELLGGPCYHMKSVLLQHDHLQAWHNFATGAAAEMDWKHLLHGYAAAVDFPVCMYYRELMELFPDAKVVLTLKDPLQWWESFSRMQALVNKARLLRFCIPKLRTIAQFTDKVVIQDVFGGRLEKENCIEVYTRHNEEVRAAVPRERLLEFDVQQGWEPLCRFLQVPVPAKPFPCLNAGIDPLRALLRKTLLRWALRG